jgi:hypothetical protein
MFLEGASQQPQTLTKQAQITMVEAVLLLTGNGLKQGEAYHGRRVSRFRRNARKRECPAHSQCGRFGCTLVEPRRLLRGVW